MRRHWLLWLAGLGVLVILAIGCREKDTVVGMLPPPPGAERSDTLNGGYLSGTLPAGTYHVLGSLTVHEDSALTLDTGVTLLFHGPYTLTVEGQFRAEGGAGDDSIRFLPDGSETSAWSGLQMEPGHASTIRMSYCAVRGVSGEGENENRGAVSVFERRLALSHCGITDNECSGISSNSGILEIRHSLIARNRTRSSSSLDESSGGGIYCVAGSMTVDTTIIEQNRAAGSGGGLMVAADLARLTRCTIRGNEAASHGGGVAANGFSLVVTECRIDSNRSTSGSGGGAHLSGDSATFTRCSLSRNRAERDGGGVWSAIDCASFIDCALQHNTAGDNGGAAAFPEGPSARLEKCVLSHNTAAGGGALWIQRSSPVLIQCTIAANRAATGGGVYLHDSEGIFNSTILVNSDSSAVHFVYSPEATFRHCDIFGSEGPLFTAFSDWAMNVPEALGLVRQINANGDSCDTYFNLLLDPQLADVGFGDFTPANGSPVCDGGDPELPRDVDNTVLDIGAVRCPSGE